MATRGKAIIVPVMRADVLPWVGVVAVVAVVGGLWALLDPFAFRDPPPPPPRPAPLPAVHLGTVADPFDMALLREVRVHGDREALEWATALVRRRGAGASPDELRRAVEAEAPEGTPVREAADRWISRIDVPAAPGSP